MKKRMSKILSILLISALVVSTGGVVQAADAEDVAAQVQVADGETVPEEEQAEVAPAEEIKTEVPAAVEEKAETEEVKKEEPKAEEAPEMDMDVLSAEGAEELETIDAAGMAGKIDAQYVTSKDIPVKMAVTGDETITENDLAIIQYTQDDVKGDKYCGYSQQFNAPAKGLLNLGVILGTGERTVYYGVFKDAEMTQEVADATRYVAVSEGYGNNIFRIPAAGTYYIGVYSTCSSNVSVNQTVGAAAIFYNGGDRTISNGQTVMVGQKDAQTNYFKFKAANTGYLRVTGDNTSSKVALCNSSKKALSGDTYFKQTPTYGVTKGKTYYIRINSGSSSIGYRFKVDNVKISEKSGKSKAKAVNVKKGKTVKGTIQAGSGQADWYKFKLTGKKNVTINVTTGSNDALKLIVYKGGKKVGNGSRTIYNNATGKLYSSSKWTKGTYYIKVLRANGKSSGYYSLKWK